MALVRCLHSDHSFTSSISYAMDHCQVCAFTHKKISPILFIQFLFFSLIFVIALWFPNSFYKYFVTLNLNFNYKQRRENPLVLTPFFCLWLFLMWRYKIMGVNGKGLACCYIKKRHRKTLFFRIMPSFLVRSHYTE